MTVALWTLAATLAFVLAAGVLVLVTPVTLALNARTAPDRRLTVALRFLGGLAPPIPVHDTAREQSKKAKPKDKPRKKAKRGRRGPGRAGRMIAAAPQLAAGLLRPIHLDHVRVDADIGLEDPADTGHLFGLVAALNAARPSARAVSVTIRPDFTRPRLSGEVDARLRVVPAAWIGPCLRFAWRVFGSRS